MLWSAHGKEETAAWSVLISSLLPGLSVKVKFGCDRQRARNNNSLDKTSFARSQADSSTPSPETASYWWSLRHLQHGFCLVDQLAAPDPPSRAQEEGQRAQGPLPLFKDPSWNQHSWSARADPQGLALGQMVILQAGLPNRLFVPDGCVPS